MKICSSCKQEKPDECFSWRNKTKGIRTSYCKECHTKYLRNHYLTHKKYYLDKRREQDITFNEWFTLLKSSMKCCMCPEDSPECLDFHHLNPEEKEHDMGYLRKSSSKIAVYRELKKCVAICSNCHRKVHSGRLVLSKDLLTAYELYIAGHVA